jgi:hypothetical protein
MHSHMPHFARREQVATGHRPQATGPQALTPPLTPLTPLSDSIPFELNKPDYLLWGCFRSSFASSSTPAGCLLQLIHGLDEGTRGVKSQREKKAISNKEREGFSIQATLSPGSFRSSLNRADQSTIDRVDYRHRLPVGFPLSAMPPPDCTCVAGHASNFLRPTP